MFNPETGLPYVFGSSWMDISGNYYGEIRPTDVKRFQLNLEDDEVELTPEQLAKIKQEIAEENARKAEIERKKSKLQKFFERYIHFF